MTNTALRDAGDAPHSLASSTYVTDEARLYRVIGPVDGSVALVMVEDCHTLDVILIEPDRVDALRLRDAVRAADGLILLSS